MGIMPHRDVERALKLALGLDIPFWPQLPNVSFYEDMYAQSSQNFPGVVVDPEAGRISFRLARFEEELDSYFERMDSPDTFVLSPQYSAVFCRFLQLALDRYPAIKGQITGPVSFGLKIIDEERKPMIFNETVRGVLFDFIQRKANVQYNQLKEKNENAFVWVDEPGLGGVFSSLSGYNDLHAAEDFRNFWQGIEGPKAMHLCADVNLPYLLGLGIDLLSFDAYQIEFMPKEYAPVVADFLRGGGTIAWGIVPTGFSSLTQVTPEGLVKQLTGYWGVVTQETGMSLKQIAEQALVTPARCCLRVIEMEDAGAAKKGLEWLEGSASLSIEEKVVERAFAILASVSSSLRERFRL